jgi:enolase-phosphatase E1
MTDRQRQAIRCVLLDIEGTTTPVAFVHEVLFPYARTHVKSYLAAHIDSPEVLADVTCLRDEHVRDAQQHLNPPVLVDGPRDAEIDSLVLYVQWLIDRDRKSPGLKSLQGKIWEKGYADGTLRAPLYPDVLPAFECWRGSGQKIAIFSSGSVAAQKLLFAHTDFGDVSQFITEYFDTNTGPKTLSQSYSRIAGSIGLLPEEILFVSDVVAELDPAEAAGLLTLLCIRPGNQPQPPTRHHTIHSFDEILS